MRDHEVGAVALGDVEHLGAHLDTGRRHGERLELEPLLGREVLEDPDGFAAGRVVEEEVSELLALEPAELLLDEVHRRRALRPVRRGDREDVRVAHAVGRRGGAEARRRPGDAVLGELLRQRVDVRRAVNADHHGAFLLVPLVRLHALRHLVLVVDFVGPDLIALDPALGVDQVDV